MRVILALSLIFSAALYASTAVAQDPCRPRELSDVVAQSASQAADDSEEPFAMPPTSIAIVYDASTWSGLSSPQTFPQMMLPLALEEIQSTDPASRNCARRYPFADTVFLRHPGIFPAIPVADRDRFIAAEIARSTSVVFEILDSLASKNAGPLTRYRAFLEMLNRAQRAPDGLEDSDLKALLDKAWKALPAAASFVTTTDIAPEADLHFVSARLCLNDGNSAGFCIDHLNAALAADPWFSAARQMRIELLDGLIRRVSPTDAQNCDQLQSLLLIDINNLLNGLEGRRSRVDLGLSLDAAAQRDNPVLLIGAAYALRQGGATRLAEAAFAEVESGLTSEHPCNPVLREALDELQ